MENAPEEVKKLLDYIETKQTADAFTQKLDREVESVKHSEKWRREYMKAYVHDIEMKYLGKEEGKAEGKADFILKLLQEKGAIAPALRDRILEEYDISCLDNWFQTAMRAESIEAFTKEAGLSLRIGDS